MVKVHQNSFPKWYNTLENMLKVLMKISKMTTFWKYVAVFDTFKFIILKFFTIRDSRGNGNFCTP